MQFIERVNEVKFQRSRLINVLTMEQQEYYPLDVSDLINQVKVLETYLMQKNRYFALFSHNSIIPIYLSKNIETLGLSIEKTKKKGIITLLDQIYWKQVSVGLKIHQWGQRFKKANLGVERKGNEAFFCGLKIRDKKGQYRTLFIKQRILTISETSEKLFSFFEIEEITSFYKADFIWAIYRYKGTNSIATKRVYFSSGSKKEYQDLLSNRELEILKLITQSKDSKTISQLLGISIETVKKHRKNMIARIGVKDTTSLIHICRLCNVL